VSLPHWVQGIGTRSVQQRCGVACIIEGAASGADHMAFNWAKDRGVEVLEFSADWKTHGKSAGPMRNRQMLNDGQPTAVVAFPGGRGTADMIRAAKAVGLPVWEPVKVTARIAPASTRPTVTPPSDIASS
jgi:hypothetical protein